VTFHSIQALRAVAAILVVVQHYLLPLKFVAKQGINDLPVLFSFGNMGIFGAVGIPIFFVISGFVMGLQPETSGWRGSWDFFERRLLRIVPIYWFLTIVVFIYYGYHAGSFDAVHLLRSLTFTSGGSPVILPGWTLEYEMMFYVAFAAIVASGVFGSSTRGIAVLISLFVVFAVANVYGARWAMTFYPIILEFCAGLIVSRLYRQTDVAAMWPAYLLVALAIFGVSAVRNGYSMPMIDLHWAVASFFLVLGLVCAEANGYVFGKGRLWALLGDASYSIYLVHYPFMAAFGLLFWRWPALQTLPVADLALAYLVTCGVLAGVLVHLVIEKPMAKGLKRLLLTDRRTVAA